MSARVLLNLLNELRKRDKMGGLIKLYKSMIVRFYLSYDIKITWKSHFWRKIHYNFVIMNATLLWML